MQRLPDGLADGLDVEPEQRADARCGGGTEMRHVIDLVPMQADGPREVDLDLVSGRDAARERAAVGADVLRDREDRGDVVTGMRVLGREERVVVVELTHRHAVGPCRPLGARAAVELAAEDRGARAPDRYG